MADDKQSGSGLGGSVILLVVAAASAVYVGWHSPLVSTRPTTSDYDFSQTAQDIDARLWQDPVGAVERAIEDQRNAKGDPAAGHCLADFRRLLNQPSGSTLLVGVSLPGDPYPEADETRRRLRYAVLSALHVANYLPVDERHIGYLLTHEKPASAKTSKPETVASGFSPVAGPGGANSTIEGMSEVDVSEHTPDCVIEAEQAGDNNKLSVPAIVPFEQYETAIGPKNGAATGHKRVVVLWLDEEALAHRLHPIASLASLLCELRLYNHKDNRFVFVGPGDSNVLQTMVQEIEADHYSTDNNPLHQICTLKSQTPSTGEAIASEPVLIKSQPEKSTDRQPPMPLVDDLPIYNFGATAEDQIILNNAGVDPQGIDIQSKLHEGGVRYFRSISSDRGLAEVLAQELKRRGIDLCPKVISQDVVPPAGSPCRRPHHDRVFLLSEWDTAYGRSLPESVSKIFGADDSSFGACRLDTSYGIMHASYLRGLDGRLPSRRPAKDGKPAYGDRGEQNPGGQVNGTEPAATPDTTRQFEAAEGQSQFDYLRRLTADLRDCDRKLRLDGAGKIAAIGVLGSDVYDKLLLLQALRPEFPEAIFFTTDLDELLLPQGKSRYTRNLLVASGYGLALIPKLQKDVLPFRSTYQTSVFLATRLAIRNDDLAYPNHKSDTKTDPKPYVWVETTAALNCWSKQPQLFQIGRTAPRGLPTGPVSDEKEACKQRGKDPNADFVNYASIQPAVAPLYPDFTYGARWGTFLFPIVLLSVLFFLPSLRKVFFYRVSPAEATREGGQPAHFVTSDLAPRLVWLRPLVAATLMMWVLATIFWPTTARWLTEYPTPNGEPMTLFEGLSIWPTVASRTFGIILSLSLIWYTLRILQINLHETAREMGVPLQIPSLSQAKAQMEENYGIKARWEPSKQPEATDQLDKGVGADAPDQSRLLPVRKKIGWAAETLLWFPPQSSYRILGNDHAGRPEVKFKHVANGFSLTPGVRCLRAFALTILMMLLWSLILVPIFGDPSVAARGDRARDIYWWVTLFDVIFTLFLTMLVTDATIHSRSFIVRLTNISTRWPHETRSMFKQRFGVQGDGLADWLDMKYIALKTACITQLIYLPFLSLSLLFLSRSYLFDDFSTPWTLPVFEAISIALVVGSVLAYRFAAENARTAARKHLTAKIISAQGDEKAAGQLERMLNEIEGLKEGAFAPLTSQPVVKAVLLPLVTYGGVWLTHLYGLPGS